MYPGKKQKIIFKKNQMNKYRGDGHGKDKKYDDQEKNDWIFPDGDFVQCDDHINVSWNFALWIMEIPGCE